MRVGGEGWTMLDVKFSGDNFELFRVEIQHSVILVYGTVVARMLEGIFWEGDPFETSDIQALQRCSYQTPPSRNTFFLVNGWNLRRCLEFCFQKHGIHEPLTSMNSFLGSCTMVG